MANLIDFIYIFFLFRLNYVFKVLEVVDLLVDLVDALLFAGLLPEHVELIDSIVERVGLNRVLEKKKKRDQNQ
jgi:hypothetical protein